MEEGGRLDRSHGQGSCCPNSEMRHWALKAPVGTRGRISEWTQGEYFVKGGDKGWGLVVQRQKAYGLGNDMGWREDHLGFRVGWSEVRGMMTMCCLSHCLERKQPSWK